MDGSTRGSRAKATRAAGSGGSKRALNGHRPTTRCIVAGHGAHLSHMAASRRW